MDLDLNSNDLLNLLFFGFFDDNISRSTLSEIFKIYINNIVLYQNLREKLEFYNNFSRLNYKKCNIIDSNNKYIHPILVFLFFPKCDFVEQKMLCSNISRLLLFRSNIIQYYTKEDSEIDNKLLLDINDDKNANFTHIEFLHKSQIQNELYKYVYNLRNSNFIDDTELIPLLRSYKTEIYGTEEKSILRKIMDVFSMRPIFFTDSKNTNYQMIDINLTDNYQRLASSFVEIKYYSELYNDEINRPIPTIKKILRSNGILIFNINRKNNFEIIHDDIIFVNDQKFILNSVCILNENNEFASIIIDDNEKKYLYYNPYGNGLLFSYLPYNKFSELVRKKSEYFFYVASN
jgi:hypothetical protein